MIEVQIIYTFITGQFVDSNGKYFLDVDPEQLRITERINNFLIDKLKIRYSTICIIIVPIKFRARVSALQSPKINPSF